MYWFQMPLTQAHILHSVKTLAPHVFSISLLVSYIMTAVVENKKGWEWGNNNKDEKVIVTFFFLFSPPHTVGMDMNI